MINTVTFNPSLDYMVSVEKFKLGYTNRTCMENLVPGGKGINVSGMLKNLGIENTALGFTAGFTGEEIEGRLRLDGISTDFIRLEGGFSRINVKLMNVDGTEINGIGPQIPSEKVQELFKKLNQLQEGDVLFLAGSVPPSVPRDIYQQILKLLDGRGVCIVADTSGELLLKVLPHHPFLVKPNRQELEEVFDVALPTVHKVVTYGKKLQEMGAQNVLVSLGGEGAVLLAGDGSVIKRRAPAGRVINSVGAGDSMVAGFMAGWLERKDYEYALAMGVAAGSATAFSEGFATREQVLKLLDI